MEKLNFVLNYVLLCLALVRYVLGDTVEAIFIVSFVILLLMLDNREKHGKESER